MGRLKPGSGEGSGRSGMTEHNKKIIQKRNFKRNARKSRRINAVTIQAVTARYSELDVQDTAQFDSFSKFPLSVPTQKGLEDNKFIQPTEIQRDSLLFSLRGVDVVGAAKTGSGKTLAFLIPLLECLWRQRWSRTSDGLGALVITPTRELAYQIFHVLNKVGAHHHFSAALLIGGNDVEFEKERVGGVNIVISTPGRLLQHMDENTNFTCDHLQMLVIDEADRILDLGFETQMNAILSNLPNERQTLLFSATQTKNVKELTRLALNEPVYVSVHENAPEATPRQLQQARFLTKAFCHLRPGLSLSGLWGTMKQCKRIEVFEAFNRKTFAAALIATDVASRGLDFERVDWVLQLDCPATVEDYIHRVGRTARMDAKGEAALILTPSQEEAMIARLTARKIPITKISVDPKQIFDITKKLQTTIIQFQEMKEYAQRSFLAYIRSVYMMQHKDIFDVKKIDVAALAKSYGLSTAPRIRFLARAALKSSKTVVKGDEVENPGRKEKTITELLEMMKGTSNNQNDDVFEENDSNMEEENEDFLNGDERFVHGGKKPESVVGEEDDSSDGNDEDLLKVARHDVFHVLDTVPAEEGELIATRKRNFKPISRQAAARKLLKKGAQVNVKKTFTDDDEIQDECSQNKDAKETEVFSIEEAKQEMAEIDKLDKAAYREKLKKRRKEKKAKLKKRLEENKQHIEGAVLDLGEGSSEASEEPDLSWLPDPDKPRKYDELWNEISEDKEKTDVSHITKNGSGKTEAPRRKRKKKNQETVKSVENEALKLLGLK